ncbi:MAG: YkgJ family cysteine cluster protein [archaeon]|nr:YkgJ family cysteine cluster protein [archaeon]MDA1130087.1 YkgJ family cysteine cluster protein [archaeon]
MGRSLPCIPMGCSACCRETTMPLTKAEAAKLARRTGMAVDTFSYANDSGILTLLNDETTRACVFLLTDSAETTAEGVCSVYDARPKGCQTYPYVLAEDDTAILDEGCPHREQFPPPSDDDAATLLNLEERILSESRGD